MLEQANRAKTHFLTNASHEMRTPLTVISVNIQTAMGLLKRMDNISIDNEVQTLLQNAQAEIMRLSRMVSGMLSLNAMAGTVEKSKTDITALLNNTVAMIRLLVEKKNNRLVTEISGQLVAFCSADLFSQVIVNPLQNSNAHTEGGVISLRAQQSDGTIMITVTDNGCGIISEMLPYVFERGVTDGGTGVGLYLCKTIMESHGGTIEIKSEVGSGTVVTLTLPTYQGQFGGEKT